MGPFGIFFLLVLVSFIWATVGILRSAASTEDKILWITLVLILPVFGFFIWFVAGPRRERT